jgi:ABC-type multidrug transport system fused ATPase/permease subunit
MIPILRSLAYARRYWGLLLLALLSLALATIFSLSIPRILREVIDGGLPQPFRQVLFSPRFLNQGLAIELPRPELIFQAALLLLALSVLRAAVAFGTRYFGDRLSQWVAYDLRDAFYNKVQNLHFAYHDQSQMGQIITRAITDIDAVRMFISQGFIEGLTVIMLALGVIAAMITLNPPLTLVTLLPLPLIIYLALRMGVLQIPRWYAIMDKLGGLSNLLEENAIGMNLVRAFNRQEAESQRWATVNQELHHAQISFTETWSTYFPAMAFCVSLSTALLLWQGGPQVISGQVSIGTIVALNGYILLIALPVQRFGFFVQQYSSSSTSARRIFEILDVPIEIKDKPDAVALPPIEGHIAFDHVHLEYATGGEALHDITFSVEPNQVIGLVGPTGGGKSSIVNLLPRFYDVSAGRLTIDGHDVRDVKLDSLRSQIGIVQQETLLFTASVKANIAFGRPNASDEEIIAAAKAADAHRFIMEMPDGYETRIGERGVTLSGGQRQRIAIARALLVQPRILILDDATSSVDTLTERSIQAALEKLMDGRVTFIVAQRLSALRRANLILVVADGRIVERGTHESLLTQRGHYWHIFQEQIGDQPRLEVGG